MSNRERGRRPLHMRTDLYGPGRRMRLRLWLRGRRDGRIGLPTPTVVGPVPQPAGTAATITAFPAAAHPVAEDLMFSTDPAAWATPAVLELEALASRSHQAIGAAALDELAGVDEQIARLEAELASLRAPSGPDDAELDAPPRRPTTADDDTARRNRLNRAARARRDGLRNRVRAAELELAELRGRREARASQAVAAARAVTSFCEQAFEVYRAANLRRRGKDLAPRIAAAWPRPRITEPEWLADLRPSTGRAASSHQPVGSTA